MKSYRHKWALVLSGGGARGFAHIGILTSLEEAGFPKPSLVVGTSMGAIVGGLYACGMTPHEMEDFVLNKFNITDYIDGAISKIHGPVGKVIQTGQALANLATRPGADTGHRALEFLEKLTRGKTFAQTEIPFRCNAVDLYSGREVVFDSGLVAKAVRASMSLPLFFEPVMEAGMCLVDGGLADNMPVTIARNEGFKRVLAVDVNSFTGLSPGALKTGPQVVYRSIECALLAQNNEKKKKASVTLDIRADATLFSFFKQKELIRLGEKAVADNMEALEKFF